MRGAEEVDGVARMKVRGAVRRAGASAASALILAREVKAAIETREAVPVILTSHTSKAG